MAVGHALPGVGSSEVCECVDVFGVEHEGSLEILNGRVELKRIFVQRAQLDQDSHHWWSGQEYKGRNNKDDNDNNGDNDNNVEKIMIIK